MYTRRNNPSEFTQSMPYRYSNNSNNSANGADSNKRTTLSLFEHELAVAEPWTEARWQRLPQLLASETWRTCFKQEVIERMLGLANESTTHEEVKRVVDLALCSAPGALRYNTPEQRQELANTFVVYCLSDRSLQPLRVLNAVLRDAGAGFSDLVVNSDQHPGSTSPLLVEIVERAPFDSDMVLNRRLRDVNNALHIVSHASLKGVNSQTGDTALHTALSRRFTHTAQYLFALGSDMLVANSYGLRPLDDILYMPDAQLIEAFNRHGREERFRSLLIRNSRHNTPVFLEVTARLDDDELMDAPFDTGRTLLHEAAVMQNRYVGPLLDRGADANALDAGGLTPLDLYSLVLEDEPDEDTIATFQRLLASTSADNMERLRFVRLPMWAREAVEAQKANWEVEEQRAREQRAGELDARLAPASMWEGWTKGDAEAFDQVFEPEHALNFTACPVCLCSVDRIDACNYMGHNCKAQPGFYHKGLYDTYKDDGVVHWCTNCGRIATASHQHYALESAGAKRRPLTFPSVDPFGHQCYPDGGGDLPEKVARFRRLREYALELQEDVGKITEQEAKEQLVEEMWNAPLVRSKVAQRVAADKAWNIPSDKFPTRQASAVEAVAASGPAPDVRKPASDAALTPVRVLQALNAWSREEVAEGVQFVHRKTDGTVNAHEGDVIGVESLAEVLQARLAARGAPEFGFCWGYPACSARLYPEDVQPFVPVDLYEAYRAKFNDKFRGATGGGKRRGTMRTSHHHRGGGGLRVTSDAEGGLLQPLVDGQCALPNAQGGGGRAKGRRRQVRHTRRTVRL